MIQEEKREVSPSIILVGVFFTLIILSAFIPAKWLGVKPVKHARLNLDTVEEINNLSLDKDNNGSPDWRDLVNATFAESDSASLVGEAPTDSNTERRLNDPNNLTASFSKNMYIASSYLKQNGGGDSISTSSQQDLINGVLAQEQTKIKHRTYTNTDLIISNEETPASLRSYGNMLGVLMQKSLAYKFGIGDIEIMKAYTENKDASVFASLIIKKDHVDEIISSMLKIPVPRSATPYHVLTLNRLVIYRDTLDNMNQVEDDPIRATIAFNGYLETTDSLIRSVSAITNYFIAKNISFSSKEAGYIFEPIYTIKK